MYVSPAVRTIRDDPLPDETVTLLVEATEDADLSALANALGDAGATVEEELEFRTLAVSVAHEDVAAVCDCAGIEAVETSNTLVLDPDGAGEDVEPVDPGADSEDGTLSPPEK